jgi:hypothetical protein
MPSRRVCSAAFNCGNNFVNSAELNTATIQRGSSSKIMKSFLFRSISFRLILTLVFLAVAVGVLVVLVRPTLLPVSIIPMPTGFPTRKPTFLDRCQRAVPLWAWRLKDSILGPRQVITLDAAIFEFRGSSDSALSSLSWGRPEYADTNGLRIWMLGESDRGALRRRLEQTPGCRLVSSPRVTTAHGIQSQVSEVNTKLLDGTPSNVGLVLDFLPRVRREATDLTTIMTVTEAVTNWQAVTARSLQTNVVSTQTNLALAARIQIPKGSDVFLLQPNQGGTNGKSIAVLISAKMQ